MSTRTFREDVIKVKAGSSAPGQAQGPEPRVVELPPALTVKQLGEALGASPIEIIKQLMRNGVMAAINQVIDFDSAAIVAVDMGFEARRKAGTEKATGLLQQLLTETGDASQLEPRPPVVTIMGHVDHGKTTLLDTIRHSNLASREVGGITQHIGAYQIEYKSRPITFLDTPGHEAFTAMRARGAQITDIAILVVAADDGVMPQTREAADHARAANLPILVAINKIDKPGADAERVKRELAQIGLAPEGWGGNTVMVPISAKQGSGIDDLLETLLLMADMKELKANPSRPAIGAVIEARVDKSRGPTATVLVQHGTLKVGDNIVVGDTWGRVKALITDLGRRVREGLPGTPVEVLGLAQVPKAGDLLVAVPDEKTAKQIVDERLRQANLEKAVRRPLSLESILSDSKGAETKELLLIIKCDVQGSIEAIQASVQKVSSEKVRVRVLRSGTGSITESDVLLAIASKAVIIGFNSRPEPGAQRLAAQEGVEIRFYDIIYNLVADIEKALAGLLEPLVKEMLEGHAEVKAVFSGTKHIKVAGCLVKDGKLAQGATLVVLRSNKQVFKGVLSSLRRFKDDVHEVPAGTECGVILQGFNDFQVGDTLESFRIEAPDQASR
ncbi:MAG: translation initiation factor IF-2 [Chloroflexi bacterium]|nr:translation initiation factor IF-2 [Chloroflexota bacterium]